MLSEKKIKEEKFRNMKIKTPFPKLPSFHSSAVIISYLGYEDEIHVILQSISRNTYSYYICHRKFISAFLTPWKPEFDQAINFGQLQANWPCSHPNEQALRKLPSYKPIQLHTINYKSYQGALTAIQFEFTEGISTPFFEAKGA